MMNLIHKSTQRHVSAMAVCLSIVSFCPTVLRAEPGIKSITLKTEFGDVREILGIRSVMADFELTEPASSLKFYYEIYKNGELKDAANAKGGQDRTFAYAKPVGSGSVGIQIADGDYLHLGDPKESGKQPVVLSIMSGEDANSYKRTISKDLFDVSDQSGWGQFDPVRGGKKFPIFYMLGRNPANQCKGGNTVEDLLKRNPTGEFLVAYLEIADGPANIAETKGKLPMSAEGKVVMSDDEWKKILTPEQFTVLRGKGTECAFTGAFWDEHRDGIYECAGCGQVLFDTKTKFNSGTGWPSFYDAIDKKAVKEIRDLSHGMVRTEVQCARCDGHLGHVFEDGPKPTGLRFCINSAALKFVERKGDSKEAAKEKPHE